MATVANQADATSEPDDDNDDEDLLSANSPLGRYAAEVGLADALTPETATSNKAEELADEAPDAGDHVQEEAQEGGWLAGLVLSRLVAGNAAQLRRLLAEDDMRELLLAVSDATGGGGRRRLQGGVGAVVAGVVAVAAGAVTAALNTPTMTAAAASVVAATAAVVAAVPLAGLRLLSGRLSALLAGCERCLAGQRACVRLVRERQQVERGFTLVHGGASSPAASAVSAGRCSSALGRAAFESARRLTHSARRLARTAGLGGLAVQAVDADFGDAFDARLTPLELATATDGFAAPAIASMAGLLQLHLSDTVRRLLVAVRRRPGRRLGGCLRLAARLSSELAAEADSLDALLERQRRLDVDVDTLLAEFFGTDDLVPLPVRPAQTLTTPMQSALRSLRLQAEALLAKAAMAERRIGQQEDDQAAVDLTAAARVHAVNAVACCDEIEAAASPPSPTTSPSTQTPIGPTEGQQRTAPIVVAATASPLVEDEFLEGVVPAYEGEGGNVADDDEVDELMDAAARRSATRRLLGELDSVIAQRRLLFRERERLARVRRSLPPIDVEDVVAEVVGSKDGEDEARGGRRRRIVWHGTLVGEADGVDGVAKEASATSATAFALSGLAAAALAARRERGIQQCEETFGDGDDSD